MRRAWTILATLIAALAVSMGSAGLRAVHVATSAEHAAHDEGQAHAERAAAPCGHTHGHSCESERDIPADHGQSHDSHDHDVDCATCELLTTLTSDIAMPELAVAPTAAAGEPTGVACALPATRTLASVRARPPPTA